MLTPVLCLRLDSHYVDTHVRNGIGHILNEITAKTI